MNVSQLSDDQLKRMTWDAERAAIVSFRDISTLRKLIAAFEDDLGPSGKANWEAAASGTPGTRDQCVKV